MNEKIEWQELAKKALEEIKAPAHVNDIATIIKKKAWTELTEEEIARKVATSLANAVKRASSDFKREKNNKGGYKKGVYALKQKRKPAPSPVPVISVSTAYTGKGGELAVLSELLFRGYNASIMTVDEGIDLVASKDNKYFHIQVKTATQNDKNSPLKFTIRGSAYQSAFATSTFYVLVIRKNFKNITTEFIILHNNIIDSFIKSKILSTGKNGDIAINVTVNTKGEYFLGTKTSLHNYVGDFSQIQ